MLEWGSTNVPLTLRVCHLLVVAADQDDPGRQDPSPSSRRREVVCRREATAVRGTGWAEEACPESSCQSESPSIQGALFPRRALLWGDPPLPRLKEGPLLNGAAAGHGTGQEFCGRVHPWREHREMRHEAPADFIRQKLWDTGPGGGACASDGS